MTDFEFNPFDPAETQHMWDLMARMRTEAPVSRPTAGFVYLATHADVKAGFRDAKTLSSAEGFRSPGVVVSDEESFLGEIDPPLHTDVRRFVLPAFSPQAAASSEPWTRATVSRMIGRLAEAGRGDLMQLLCIPLPGAAAAHGLGLPDELHEQLTQWTTDLLHSTWPATNETERGVGIGGSFPELANVLDQAIAERRASGDQAPDDLLTRMIRAEHDGARLTDVHVRTLAVNSIAGSLSTTYLLGNLLHRFVADPVEFTEVLRARPDLIPMAVEESLRFEPPVLFLFRTALADTEFSGCPVHRGERLLLGIASANRDERVFPDAEQFRLDRDRVPDNHLSFGSGQHLCLGNHLTRLIGRVVLEEMLATFEPGQLVLAAGYERHLVPMFLEYGPETLDVEVVEPGEQELRMVVRVRATR